MDMNRIGYIDEDKGWLQTFTDYFRSDFKVTTFEVTTNSTVENIITSVLESEVELIAIDFRLNETGLVTFNADTIVEAILKQRPHFPILILTSYEPDAINTIENVNIINGKDILDGESQDKVEVLKKKIKAIIDNYYHRIAKAENDIENLTKKSKTEALSSSEQELLIKQYIYLDEINPNEKIFATNQFLPEEISRLSNFVVNTKQILEELKKINGDA